MVAKTLVLLCTVVALVSGNCVEIKAPQDYSTSQFISLPVQGDSSFSSPVLSNNVFSSGSTGFISAPIVSDNVYSSGSSSPSFSTSVVAAPAVSENVFSSGSSGNSFSELLSSGSSAESSFGMEASNGPEPSPLSVIQAPGVTLPAVEGSIITLSSQPIPPPRVLAQRCICTKTVVKPQVYQRVVTVPKIQRYIQRTVSPVVENVTYKSTPITQGSSSGASTIVFPGSSSGSSCSSSSTPVVFSSDSESSYGSQSRYVSSPVVVSSGSSCQRLY